MAMPDSLSAQKLMSYVKALAQEIGPRPPGSVQERQARDYIRQTLTAIGLSDIDEIPFLTNDTWGYSLIIPTSLALVGNLLGHKDKKGQLMSSLLSFGAAYSLWRPMNNQSQPFFPLYPKGVSGTLLTKIPPIAEKKHRVVLIGHTDTNKHRASFSPARKKFLLALTTLGVITPLLNGLAQLMQAVNGGQLAAILQRLTFWGLGGTLAVCVRDELDSFIDGANDNATAVACLLGLGSHLQQNPLQHTEVWLAFTGAEETGLFGTHALLDKYGHTLQDAWFIDFEMVGSREIAYVTQHSSLSYLMTAYTPDEDSLALAEETSRLYPELQVNGRPMVISEEVGALRRRGYRGICLVGVGPDGYLENWHQHSDTVDNIEPSGLERAARFALAMMQTLDGR